MVLMVCKKILPGLVSIAHSLRLSLDLWLNLTHLLTYILSKGLPIVQKILISFTTQIIRSVELMYGRPIIRTSFRPITIVIILLCWTRADI